MHIGIFGEPFSGKSTLLRVLIAGFGHRVDEIKGRKGLFVVNIPDERVDYLAGVYKPKRQIYPTITLVEIPPVGENLFDPQSASTMKGCDLLVLVIPLYRPGMGGKVSPDKGAYDYFREIETELCLGDYMVAQNRLERLEKERKKTRELELMKLVVSTLESSTPLRDVTFRADEKKVISGFSLLSEIPIIVVMNVDENYIRNSSVIGEAEKINKDGVDAFVTCARLEEEIMSLEPEEREPFMSEVGLEGFIDQKLVLASYRLLNLITFLTVNPNEVRAWNINKGASAREAAGKVHSDMKRGFIRAEVISFDDFVHFESMAEAKSAGKVRVEGKEYLVQDGDIVTIRFNV